jgi:hypothetical protein
MDTIDTVMGHISSNLHPREPWVTLEGSSSMAGSCHWLARLHMWSREGAGRWLVVVLPT